MSRDANPPPGVVITGCGAFGAAGTNAPAHWQSALSARDCSTMRQLPSGLTLPVYAAPDPVFPREDFRLLRRADRSALLALAAAREAWTHARLHDADLDPARVGVIIGSSRGPTGANLATTASRSPTDSLYTTFASLAGIVADILKTEGCALMASATCTSGAVAAHMAMQMLRAGLLDAVLVGGADAPLLDTVLEQMSATGVLSTHSLRPFDRDRTGAVLGEGAAFLVLESEPGAAARRATVHGRLESVSLARDPGRSKPNESALALQRVFRESLQSAHRCLDDVHLVHLVHLHGSATRINDLTESRGIHALYGTPSAQPDSWATKAVTGHTLGASPLFQAILTLQAMQNSCLPATANCAALDPDCPLNLSLACATPKKINLAVCLNSGFWGNVSSIVLAAPSQS